MASVRLHYKERDVSASFALRLSEAQCRAPMDKLLKWFAAAERRKQGVALDVGQLALFEPSGRCVALDASIATTLAALRADKTEDEAAHTLLVKPWLSAATYVALHEARVADVWALFCPTEQLIVYDAAVARGTAADGGGKMSEDDIFYLRFLRKVHGAGYSLGADHTDKFKSLFDLEKSEGAWQNEKRWARHGAIPAPGGRFFTVVDEDVTEVRIAPGDAAPLATAEGGVLRAVLRRGERVAASGVGCEHFMLSFSDAPNEEQAQLMQVVPMYIRVALDEGDGRSGRVGFVRREMLTLDEPPPARRAAGEDSSDDDPDDERVTLKRPSGVGAALWNRLLAAREWKSDGDRLLALRGLRARDAALAYDRALEYVDRTDVQATVDGSAECGDPWACARLAPLLRKFWRATALNAATALLASGEPQGAIDALARTGLAADEPADVDVLFCRAEALNRLRFFRLALDELAKLDAAQLDERRSATLAAAKDSLTDKLAKLANPKRKTKKRW